MRAISLHQPWAMFIALGLKQYETRSWRDRSVVGKHLAIHAAKKWDTLIKYDVVRLSKLHELNSLLVNGDGSLKTPTLGAVLCICKVIDIYPTENLAPTPLERAVGDWSPGRYAWQLELVERFEQPIPAKGAQGFWRWDQPAEYVQGAQP